MVVHSVLFPPGESGDGQGEPLEPPFFADLCLDQVVAAITAGKQEYDLRPFFYTPLREPASVRYRQAVFRDLENPGVLPPLRAFARHMVAMRERLRLVDELHYPWEKKRWFLDAVEVYCRAVTELSRALSQLPLTSAALVGFRQYLDGYIASGPFAALVAEARGLKADLASVRYCLLIRGDRVTARRYDSEADYAAEVERVFAKFEQAPARPLKLAVAGGPHLDPVEAAIVDMVARLFPDVFARLDRFAARHPGYLDETVACFDREIRFYLAYREYIEPLVRAGLPFCYPAITREDKEIQVRGAFDLALAERLVQRGGAVVTNDFRLSGPERIMVVTGPNQGGKTTFARMVGQLHYLAALGCPVPGEQARLFLVDRLFTHFEKEERIENLRGKLQDDLVRIRAILDQATSHSLLIMNELFSSTTSQDAAWLGRRILGRIEAKDALAVYVTFIDELATLDEKTVSMVATVAPDDPAVRTYRIVRRPPDGRAYALAVAARHGLTSQRLRERLAR